MIKSILRILHGFRIRAKDTKRAAVRIPLDAGRGVPPIGNPGIGNDELTASEGKTGKAGKARIRKDVEALRADFDPGRYADGRREKLLESAREFDALLVLGCEAAVQTVRRAVESAPCDVVQGLESEGVMSIRPRFSLPCNLSLELESVTPLALQDGNPE